MTPLWLLSDSTARWSRRWILRERIEVYPLGYTVCSFTLIGLSAN